MFQHLPLINPTLTFKQSRNLSTCRRSSLRPFSSNTLQKTRWFPTSWLRNRFLRRLLGCHNNVKPPLILRARVIPRSLLKTVASLTYSTIHPPTLELTLTTPRSPNLPLIILPTTSWMIYPQKSSLLLSALNISKEQVSCLHAVMRRA